jgi:luciferase family oxidoreductase group 1
MGLAISILDLAPIRRGETPADSFIASAELARLAERLGYRRIWYAEHHNMRNIASSATSVLIAHVAAHTSTIRLGSGGVMLPNHSPLQIAEQFGTLEALHPGRIDLGLGRAPGSDRPTMLALRRDERSSERFAQDVVELRAYLSDTSLVPGVDAIPGRGSNVPLYILGSSLYGAQLAAALGLPFGFASHFAPASLQDAVMIYRENFCPSEQLQEPYVIAGVNVIAADSDEAARLQLQAAMRNRVASRLGRDRTMTDDELDAVLNSPTGNHFKEMMTYTAAGRPEEVARYLYAFSEHAQADEVIVALQSPTTAERLRSAELLAEAVLLPATT